MKRRVFCRIIIFFLDVICKMSAIVWRLQHYSDVTWAPWYLKSPATRMFPQQLVHATGKEPSKLPIIGTLWGESTGGFPSQKTCNAERFSMSWCHHVLAWPPLVSAPNCPLFISYPVVVYVVYPGIYGRFLNRHQTILSVYANKVGKTSVVWRYTIQSFGPSRIALNY